MLLVLEEHDGHYAGTYRWFCAECVPRLGDFPGSGQPNSLAAMSTEPDLVDNPAGEKEKQMPVEVHPLTLHDLELRLKEYEATFGMPTSRFVREYTDGRLPDEDAPYLDWYMTYDALRLATDAESKS